MNDPMPPVPMTATASPGPTPTRDTAWSATASGCVIAAASSSTESGTRRQIAAAGAPPPAPPPAPRRPTAGAPGKTAALTVSALDLHLHVARGVAGRVEGGRALAQREGGGQERRGVDAARRHEADRPRPHPCRPDDAAHLKGLGLHEPNLD